MAGLVCVAPAHAQSAADKAAAEALFDQGRELLKAGEYEQACKKLESSQRVDPGIGTLLYLAECYKQLGKTASAWATFREAASKAEAAGEDDRARAGSERADELEASLSRVTIAMAKENESIEDLVVQQAGHPINRALWGTAVPVDPGQLRVVVEAPGYETWESSLLVEERGTTVTLDVPPLVALPQQHTEPEQLEGDAQESTSEQAVASSSKQGSGQRTTGLVLGGLGVAGVGVGSVLGLLAMQAENDAGEFCDGDTCEAGSDGVELTERARGRAAASTIGFVAGGALLASGIALYFTAPTGRETASVNFTPTRGGGRLSLRARF